MTNLHARIFVRACVSTLFSETNTEKSTLVYPYITHTDHKSLRGIGVTDLKSHRLPEEHRATALSMLSIT